PRRGVKAPGGEGPAVRKVVARRAGRRTADDAVARQLAEVLPTHCPAELHHAADDRARHDDAVDRDVPLAASLRAERPQLDDDVLAPKDALKARFEILGRDRREEAHLAEVDADHRRPAAEREPERAEHRAVAAEDEGRSE